VVLSLARVLDEVALSDILDGSIILAAGGGGPVQAGKSLLKSMIASRSFPSMITLEELSDSACVGVPIAMGSCAVLLENFLDFQMLRALKTFRNIVGKLEALIPVETGQVNTLAVLYTAANTGLPVIDADGTGRSIPEFKNTVFYSSKANPNPFVMSDSVGNDVVLTASSLDDVDRLGRTICTEMGGLCGTAGISIDGKSLKKIAVPETISQCEKLGAVFRENRDDDPVNALVRESEGFLLIRGIIEKMESKVVHGHDYGNLIVRGFAREKGKWLRIGFKNEGLIAYRDGKPAVISPDHIFMIDILTKKPVTFTDAVEGLPVAVAALRAHPKRRTPADYDGFRDSLRDVGYTGEYVPVEELLLE
jgi:DUF917 family protein